MTIIDRQKQLAFERQNDYHSDLSYNEKKYMNNNCLLIKTKEDKQFITHEKYLNSLIEFAKVFNAEMYLIKLDGKDKPLSLGALIAAMCNSDYKANSKYKEVSKIFPSKEKQRKSVISNACQIRSYIKEKMLSGSPVSLKEIKLQYKKYTDACLSNHFSSIRKNLIKDGYNLTKLGAGMYAIKN